MTASEANELVARSIEQIVDSVQSQYRTVEEMVVSAVRQAILSGIFAPGAKLPQERLAQLLGVSRIPVRSALRKLEAEGLVVFSPHKGAAVRTLEPEEVEEIYELRILLETYALRAAIGKITQEQIDELTEMADELDAKGEGDDWLELRQRFYSRLYAIAGLSRTEGLIASLRADVGRYWLSLRVVNHDAAGHRVIVDAIRAGNTDRAERWLAEHLGRVSRELQRRVRDQQESARRS